MPDGLEVLAVVFPVVVIVFAGIALKYAAKAGAVKTIWIGAKFGKWVNLGVQIERFDSEPDVPSIPQTQVDTRPELDTNTAHARKARR